MSSADIEAWRRRRAEIIERYGDADAATAPCQRERLLLAAVAPWRKVTDGWTLAIDGWRGDGSAYRDMPARALRAIEAAIPLPTTFAAARAEAAYWETRNAELRDVLSEDGSFADNIALDLIAEVRAAIVRDLALHELPVTNIVDLHDRLTLHQQIGGQDPQVIDAVVRDVAAMAGAEQAHLSARTDTAAVIADRIAAALRADPSRSDRDVARSAGCSPTTVGRVRAAMGLHSVTRVISRGSQRFELHLDRPRPV